MGRRVRGGKGWGRGVRRILRVTENLNVTVGGGWRKVKMGVRGVAAGGTEGSGKRGWSERGATGEAGEARGEGEGGRGRGKTAEGGSS